MAPVLACAAAGRAMASVIRNAVNAIRLSIGLPFGWIACASPMLGSEAVRENDSGVADRAASGPHQANALSGAVEAQLNYPSSYEARAIAAGVAGDVELGRQGVEAALGGALADVQRLGQLGARRGATREGALAAVGGDQCGRGRPLLFAQRHRGSRRGDRAARPPRHRVRHFEAAATDDQRIAVAQAARP